MKLQQRRANCRWNLRNNPKSVDNPVKSEDLQFSDSSDDDDFVVERNHKPVRDPQNEDSTERSHKRPRKEADSKSEDDSISSSSESDDSSVSVTDSEDSTDTDSTTSDSDDSSINGGTSK
jgi:hypothetical protein